MLPRLGLNDFLIAVVIVLLKLLLHQSCNKLLLHDNKCKTSICPSCYLLEKKKVLLYNYTSTSPQKVQLYISALQDLLGIGEYRPGAGQVHG